MEIELEQLLAAYKEYVALKSESRRPIHKQNLMNCYNNYIRPRLKETHWTCPSCMSRVETETYKCLKNKNLI